jgi:hypothetical protein
MDEVTQLNNAWSELDEQNSRKASDLAAKEEQIVQLLAEVSAVW